jgi:hypothetical protein
MSAIVRETYYAALFALLESVVTTPALVTIGRKVRVLDGMNDGELPALFMAVGKQPTTRQQSIAKHRLEAHVFLYAANPDQNTTADMVLNGLIDAVEAALEPSPGFTNQTLGGVVSHCWIEGDTEVFAGPLGTRAAAIVPVVMVVP